MAVEHDETIDWERLDRFVCGAGSSRERVSLAVWVESNPRIRHLADVMRSVGGARTGAAPDARRALRSVQRQIDKTR
jgi:hypothetical protein